MAPKRNFELCPKMMFPFFQTSDLVELVLMWLGDVRKRKVGWTNAEVWISEGFIFSGLDLNVAGELAKMIKVGIAMVT